MIFFLLAVSIFSCGQVATNNLASAHVQCGSVIIEEGTIQKIDGGIEVFIVQDENIGYLMRFEKKNGICYCAT